MLTMREFQIASKIIAMEHSIRIVDLSDEFHVSSRTIKYDMERVRDFFASQGMSICSQPGKGIWIECGEEERLKILNTLSKIQKENLYYDQDTRTQKILLYMLKVKGFVTAGELADYFKVTRNTILSDMEFLENILKEKGIILNRKQRTGYRLEGTEITIRTFSEEVVRKSFSLYDVYAITNRIKNQKNCSIYEISFTEQLFEGYLKIEQVLMKAFQDESASSLKKENLILLIIRLLLSIERVKLGLSVGSLEILKDEDQEDQSLYSYFKEIYMENNLPLLRDEFLYVEGKFNSNTENIDIAKLTTSLIQQVSEKEKFPYEKDTTLYSRLLSHLTISLTDVKSNFMENPFHNMIKKNHITIYLTVMETCQTYLKDHVLLTNESFISYIVLHFLVTQKNLSENKKFKAVFVCATGRGAARLIEKMLESEVKEIEVAAHCSLLEAEEVSQRIKPDFIISVFPIKANVPVIIVEPLPTKENIKFIKKIIADRVDNSLLYNSEFESMNINMVYGVEGISQEIVILGLKIYNRFLTEENLKIKENLKFAFLSHIMLFTHRYYFSKQYGNQNSNQNSNQGSESISEVAKEIQRMMEELEVQMEMGEVDAIINYIESE